MVEYVDRCWFTSGVSGTSDFTDGTAESTYRNLAGASAVNGSIYAYVAVNGTEWEIGTGAYSSGGNSLARTTVIASSTGSKVSFTSAPKVFLTLLAGGIAEFARIGTQMLYIDADAMIPRLTNGPSRGLLEMSTNKNMVSTLDFDQSTQEFADFWQFMQKSFNAGTVAFIALWSHPSTTTNFGVAWQLQAVGIGDSDPLDVAFGTAVVVTDTGGTTNDLFVTASSGAITISSVGNSKQTQFRVARAPANGSDNMAVDARLHGIVLIYNTDRANDA